MGIALEPFRQIMVRDSPCPLCLKPVYGVSRHLLQCPVAIQMAFVLRTHAMQVDVFATQKLTVKLNRSQARELLHDPAKAGTSELTAPLQQSCYLCNEAVVDVQSWKRHMRQQHAKIWAQQEKQAVAELGRIVFGRLCPFCKTEFQKTPAVHANKCLPPLLQLVSCKCSGKHDEPAGADLSAVGIHLSSGARQSQKGEHGVSGTQNETQTDGQRTGPRPAAAEARTTEGGRGRGHRRGRDDCGDGGQTTKITSEEAGAARTEARILNSNAGSGSKLLPIPHRRQEAGWLTAENTWKFLAWSRHTRL